MPGKTITPAIRRAVRERARGCCEYCYSQLDYSSDPFNIEHIMPRAAGGSNELTNLAFACFGCNSRKGARIAAYDELSGEIAPLYHPRKHKWADHFKWDTSFTELIGVSASGRATINLLRLNRSGVVNMRQVLHHFGEHPPAPIDDE